MKTNPKTVILLIVFFFSGVSALIYQTVWIRQFGLVFGVDVFAAATVLAGFMAGLAIGNLIFGRIVDKQRRGLELFIILELGIGAFALLFPLTFQGLMKFYTSLYHLLPLGFYTTQIYRFTLSFLFLLIPTTLMGGTLPVLSKVIVKNINTLGWNIGRLYCVNNIGALLGCFATGFILMRSFGLRQSVLLAAGLNILNACIVFVLYKLSTPSAISSESLEPSQSSLESLSPRIIRLVMIVFAVEGFTTLAYEVIWTRILVGFSYDKSVTFYTTVILSFIFGLSLGSILVAKWIDKRKSLLAWFAGLEILIGILGVALLTGFAEIGRVLSEWRLSYGEGWWTSVGREYLLLFAVMSIPTTLMGMTFPIVGKICVPHLKRLGSRVGELGFLDTVGSIFGAFVAGFVMIPILGVVNATLVTAGINLTMGLILLVFHPNFKMQRKAVYVLSSLLIFVILILVLPNSGYFQHWQTRRPADRLLYYHEGADATVAVPQHTDGVKFLAINGSVTAFANYGDTRVHKMLAYLPYLLHRDPHNALIIGLGMGVTAQSLMLPDINEIDCVEINPGVVEAAAQEFSRENQRVLEQQRLQMIIDDGRSYLAMTTKEYDIITSNAVHARLSGNLYTKEFYQLCRERLNPDGIMCQWTSTNWLTPGEFKSLIAAFHSVFPHTSLWLVNAGHLLMIGSADAMVVNYGELARRLNLPRVQRDLQPWSLHTPELLLAHYVFDEQRLAEFSDNSPINRDNKPIAEFSRVVSKMQIPEILLELIRLKTSYVDNLAIDSDRWNVNTVETRIEKYSEAETYYLQGVFARNLGGEPLPALNMITQALDLQPDDYRYHEEAASLNLFLAQQSIEDSLRNVWLTNAREHLEDMIAFTPDFAFDWSNLGFVYMNKGFLAQAVQSFQKAIELQPEYPLPYIYLASIIGGQGYLDQAAEYILTALSFFPDLVEGWYRLGLIYQLKGDPEKARNAYEEVLEREPEYRDVSRRLGRLTE